jgi:5-methylcytosine-specific restriction endonuclease McrA
MPHAPNHPCSQPGCAALVPPGTRRCPRHPAIATLRQQPYQRPGAHAFYGTMEWKQFRAQVLELRGKQCVRCGRVTDSPHLDHVVPISAGGAPLDEQNVRVLCHNCHSGRTLGDIKRRNYDYT